MDMSLSKLQELVMDRDTWRAEIHGVAKSQTQLSDGTELKWSPIWFLPWFSWLVIIAQTPSFSYKSAMSHHEFVY